MVNKGPASKHAFNKQLNGSGQSVPQSRGLKISNHSTPHIHISAEGQEAVLNPLAHEPWSWFPSPVACWDGLDIGRFGNPKDETRWKIRASVLSSAHAHHGALRSLVVSEDECTVFTSGIDPGFKGSVQKWELASLSCVSGYHAHEEVCPCIITTFLRRTYIYSIAYKIGSMHLIVCCIYRLLMTSVFCHPPER